MKLQTLKLRLVHITFYTIQQPSEIMHNLYPNSRNYLGKSFSHILKYLQTSSLPNIPNCNTTYQLPYLRFIRLYLWIQRDQFFSIKPCLITIAFATSSCSYTISISCTTTHNTTPHVYIARGYIGINNVMIHIHAKPLFHTQWLEVRDNKVEVIPFM